MDTDLYNTVISGDNEELMKIGGRLNVGEQLTPTNLTVLHLASLYGHLTCVEEILSAHPSLLLKLNSRGETPLHLAARHGNYDVATALINAAQLLEHNIDIEGRSSTALEFLIRTANVESETALHDAVRYNHPNVVKLLLTVDPNHDHPQNKDGDTPLYMASFRGYHHILAIILDKCVSPTYGGGEGRTALHDAVMVHRDIACMRLLLQKQNKLIKIADNYGWTALHYAAWLNVDALKELLDADKSVAYLPDKKNNRIPLHIAAFRGNWEYGVKVLLKYCPDSFDIVDQNGQNILHIALEGGRAYMFDYFRNQKEFSSLFTQKDKNGNTPLHMMIQVERYVPEVKNYNGIDWRALNGQSLTALDAMESYEPGVEWTDDQWKTYWSLVGRSNYCRNFCPRDIEAQYEKPRDISEKEMERKKKAQERNKKALEEYLKVRETHMIVAALISTVALTAGFAVPGGLDGNAGPKQGSPILLRKTAFKAFIVTDTIALLCSLSSLFIYFVSVFYQNADKVQSAVGASAVLNIVSLITMMLAFITGTYAVLVHSLALAITVSIISSIFFLIFFLFRRALACLLIGNTAF